MDWKAGLQGLLSSKKFTAMLLGAIVFLATRLAGKLHVALEPDEAKEIADRLLGLIMLYLGSQALEDHGKGAEQVKQQGQAAATALEKDPQPAPAPAAPPK